MTDTEVILRQDAVQMIEDCVNPKRIGKMSDWEIDFMEGLHVKAKANYWFTAKQKSVIQRIWERVTTGG